MPSAHLEKTRCLVQGNKVECHHRPDSFPGGVLISYPPLPLGYLLLEVLQLLEEAGAPFLENLQTRSS